MGRSQLLEDGSDVVGALAQLREGQWLAEGEGTVQVEPPAGLGAGDLEPAPCIAPVGEPDGRTLGHATGGARPGDDRAFVQAVVKDDVAGLHPPDQGVAGVGIARGVALRAVKVDADVGAVGDLEPEPLPWIVGPAGVDLAGLPDSVRARGIREPDPRRCRLNGDGARQREQHGADEGAAVAE
jgi:hypothetical protein